MSGSAEFVSAPIVEVTKDNATVLGPVIRGAIIGADFIAIDYVSFAWKCNFQSYQLKTLV